jgi:hypothetical protein
VTRAIVTVLAVSASLLGAGCDGTSCENATAAVTSSIEATCAEPAFAGTPFCRCCVPAGLLSIDDTCTCRPLIFDVDFCYYREGPGGYPAIRAALDHAASVCSGRPVSFPAGAANDGGMCAAGAPL